MEAVATVPPGAAGDSSLRLHLGSYTNAVPGWVNIDRSPGIVLSRHRLAARALRAAKLISAGQAVTRFPPSVVRRDVTKGLPYPDGSVSWIYSSHMIEHLSRPAAHELLHECARVLRPGGVLRLATPDLRQWIEEYLAGDHAHGETPADSLMAKLGTYCDPPGSRVHRLAFRIFTGSVHQWLYDYESLAAALEAAGFDEVRPLGFREGACPDLERLETRPEGLHVEAARTR
jgi:predicted SAM-dependent methyltransferase